MSETALNLNAETRRDAELAQHVAYAEEPLRVGAKQAHEFGELATASVLEDMQAQAGVGAYKKYASHQESNPVQDSSVSHGEYEASKPETTNRDQEKIQEWLREGAVSLLTWMKNQNEIDPEHKNAGGSTGFNMFFNRRDRNGIIKQGRSKLPDRLMGDFSQENVSELVTIRPEERPFGEVNSASPHADEEAVSIIYQTLSLGYKTKFTARAGGDGAQGNTAVMHIVLPKTEADQLVQMAKDNPDLLHEVADGLMLDEVQAGQDWKDTKPPYEEWRKLNNGVSRIAFRESEFAGVRDCEVIDY